MTMKITNIILNKFMMYFKSFFYRVIIILRGGRISYSASLIIGKKAIFRVGKNIRILANVRISVLDDATFEISDNVIINHMCTLYVADKIFIDTGSRLSHQCSLIDHDYTSDGIQFFSKKNKQKIIVGKNVWLGSNVIVLKGVSIGDNCVIGAGTVITKKIQANSKVVSDNALRFL